MLFRVAFVFEPLSPRLISYYVAQRLDKWKRQELILGFKTRTKRLGKFHYKTQIDMDMNGEQAARVLDDLARKLKKSREVK
ncbi:MAG: hypothetical protein NWE94_01565 [Candidatus Bathyarchaeota archaeon]|nr:hypothetical protein [Candidatus Bathyarchaeota archaeon]